MIHVTDADDDGFLMIPTEQRVVRTNDEITTIIRIPCMIHLMAMGNLVHPFTSFLFFFALVLSRKSTEEKGTVCVRSERSAETER